MNICADVIELWICLDDGTYWLYIFDGVTDDAWGYVELENKEFFSIVDMEYDGNYYSVIFGRYVNGGFCSIPNWEVGCELATMEDIFWNAGAIGRALKDDKAGKNIAEAIAAYCSYI